MKSPNPFLSRFIALTACMILTGLGFQTTVQAGAPGYLTDSRDNPVRNRSGECWHTGAWKPDHHLDGCDGKREPQAEAAPASPEPATPVSAPMSEKVEERIGVGLVHFDFDDLNVRPNDANLLERLAVRLKSDGSVKKILLVGHTDSIGTEAYNQRLGLERAISVERFLLQKGLNKRLFEAPRSMGAKQPFGDNHYKEGRALNRRVRIEVIRLRPPEK